MIETTKRRDDQREARRLIGGYVENYKAQKEKRHKTRLMKYEWKNVLSQETTHSKIINMECKWEIYTMIRLICDVITQQLF